LATNYTSTDSASLGGTLGGAGLVQRVYDKKVEFALRDEPLIRAVADKRPVAPTHNGNVVVLQKYADLALATTALTETSDIDGVTIATPTSVTITMSEFGNATDITNLLKISSFTEIDPDVVTLLARNQADSIDALAMTQLRGGSNVIYSGSTATSTATVTAAATLTSANISKAVAKLRGNKASGKRGQDYWAGIHPDVSHDLMLEAGNAGWLVPNAYGIDQSRIWSGEIGRFKGAFFVESPRLYSAADGAASAKVYRTILAGQQALAEAVKVEPNVVVGPQTDKLRRFFPIGWYGVLGFARYREEALYRIESGSSIAS
jgi:N4-gp56 family major capsid protein